MAVVNPTESTRELDLSITGVELQGKGRHWRPTGPTIDSMTGLSRHEVQVAEIPLTETPKTLKVAPVSIEVYELERQ